MKVVKRVHLVNGSYLTVLNPLKANMHEYEEWAGENLKFMAEGRDLVEVPARAVVFLEYVEQGETATEYTMRKLDER